jgi:Zn-finger nucleic acid-binding protein
MDNSKKPVILEIKGLKCDNPNCDYRNDDISFDDYEVGTTCPECGGVILTQEDYDHCVSIIAYVNKLNKIVSTINYFNPFYWYTRMFGKNNGERVRTELDTREMSKDYNGNTHKYLADKIEETIKK